MISRLHLQLMLQLQKPPVQVATLILAYITSAVSRKCLSDSKHRRNECLYATLRNCINTDLPSHFHFLYPFIIIL